MVSYEQNHRRCGRCRVFTLHYRQATNHVLHLMVTVLLCGWWAPVWVMLALKIGGWRCKTCGYRGSLLLRLGIPVVCIVGGLTVGGWVLSGLTAPGPGVPERPAPNGPVTVAEEETPDDAAEIEATDGSSAKQMVTVDGHEIKHQSGFTDLPAVEEVATEPQERLADVDRPAVEYRTWIDATGEHKTEAVFRSYGMGQVTLEKKDGQTVRLPMEQLSDADQAWVRNRIGKH